MNLLRILNESFENKYLIEAKQDRINFENKFGKELTDKFFDLRQKLKAPENNIYYWIKNKSKEELQDFIDSYQSKSDKVKKEKSQGAELIFYKNNVKIYRITTYNACKLYGQNTKWCITGGESVFTGHIESDNLDGGYYFVITPDTKYCVLKMQ